MNVCEAYFEKKELIGNQTYQITLKFLPEVKFNFKPGQYIWLILPHLDFPDPKGERRAFSITSSSADEMGIAIQVRISESGYKKTLFNLPEEFVLQVIGPYGSSYVIDESETKNITMIAGGAGIAPFSSILRSVQSSTTASKLKVVYCSSSPESSCFAPDLDQICSQRNIPVTKHLGDFRENILPSGIDFTEDLFFVCGPEQFVISVCTVLFSRNVPISRIHLEQFYPSPSGNLKEEDFSVKAGEKNIMLQAVGDSKNHVIITDANGRIVFANKTAERNTGFTFDEMRGQTPRLWGGLMTKEFYRNFWLKKHEAGGFDGVLTNRRKNNQPYQVIAHISPIHGETNNIIGYIGTEEDISERMVLEMRLKTQNEELHREKQKDEVILANIGDGIIVINSAGVVLLANPSALKMFGFTKEEMIGKIFSDIVLTEDENGQLISKEGTSAGDVNKKIDQEITYTRKDGTKFDAHIFDTPISEEGVMIGEVLSIRDITAEKKIDKAKTEFISLASHQLRTPLSTINWYTESILSGETGLVNPNQKQFLDEIYTASQRMVTLVNSLLNVSRIELGTFIIDPAVTDLVKLIESEINELAVQSEIKKIYLNYIKNVDHLELPIDVKLIQMVLQNIIANAIKYSPENSQIEVALTKNDQDVTVVVKDQGIGIPQSDQARIFSKLFRAVNAKEKVSDGNGLGLYLAKMIMDQSGGKVWFESEEGKGTAFHISLPLSGMIKKDGSKALS